MNSTGFEIAGAQALPLSGLVNYRDGSVVTPVILKRDKGNVTFSHSTRARATPLRSMH